MMPDYTLRPWQPQDRPALLSLWQEAFGDSPDYINMFCSIFLKADGCIVAEAEGTVISAMYIMDGPELRPYRKNTLSTAYTYALATLPAFRGRGVGTAVYKACVQAALARADAACVLPAEQSLYPFYRDASGSAPISFAREARFTREELKSIKRAVAIRIPSLEYGNIREMLLGGMPHAIMTDDFFQLEEYTAEAQGGGFFVAENGAAAAVELDGGTCRITELLDPAGDGMAAVAGIAPFCPAKEYIVRSPAFFNGPGEKRPFMLATLKQPVDYPLPDDLWWGFSFD